MLEEFYGQQNYPSKMKVKLIPINEKREFVTRTSALGEIPKGDFEAEMKGPRQLFVHMKK